MMNTMRLFSALIVTEFLSVCIAFKVPVLFIFDNVPVHWKALAAQLHINKQIRFLSPYGFFLLFGRDIQ